MHMQVQEATIRPFPTHPSIVEVKSAEIKHKN